MMSQSRSNVTETLLFVILLCAVRIRISQNVSEFWKCLPRLILVLLYERGLSLSALASGLAVTFTTTAWLN